LKGNAFGIRYSGRIDPRYSIHFDMVMAQQGGRLLVVEQPALIDGEHHHAGDRTPEIAATALGKLRKFASVWSRAPLGQPAATRP
jgi:hypothetical protein